MLQREFVKQPGIKARNIKTAKAVPPLSEEGVPQQGNHHYSIGSSTIVQVEPAIVSADAEIRIIYPLDHDRFVLNRNEQSQMIKLQAAVARPVSYVDWFVNGRLFKRTVPPYMTYWPLEEGKYSITAVTPSNGGDAVHVTVE